MIQLGAEHVVPLINLMHEQMLSASLIHMDETTVQVLKSDKAPYRVFGTGLRISWILPCSEMEPQVTA